MIVPTCDRRQIVLQTRNDIIEEIAQFVETHQCVIDWERGRQFYKTIERKKHPLEPLAMAIRGLKHAA